MNRAPVVTAIADQTSAENAAITLAVTASDPDGDALTYSATGLPAGLSISPTTGVISGTLSYTSAGTHSVTVTASDGTLSGSQTFTWTVTNVNRAPVVTAIANQTSAENATISLAVTASDPDGDPLTYSATGLPASLSINPTTGAITGTLSYTSAGPYCGDGDGLGRHALREPVVHVDGDEREPRARRDGDRESDERGERDDRAGGDGERSGRRHADLQRDRAAGEPEHQSGDRRDHRDVVLHQRRDVLVTVTASDGTLSASQAFTWTVTNVNRAPVVTAIANQTSAENATISLATSATDPDGDTVTYSATGLPASLSINPTTGAITGTLSYTSAGPYTVIVTASDGTLSGSQTFTWTVTNVNRAPVVTAIANQTSAENATITLAVTASDPDGDALTYSATGLPAGLSINPTTGAITGTLSYTSAGPHTVTVTASDGTLSASQSFTWTVTNVNRAPVVTAIANQTSAENAPITLAVTASDPDGDALTYSATGLPASLSLSPTTGVISGTLSYTSAGIHSVTVTASDGTLSGESELHVDGDEREPGARARRPRATCWWIVMGWRGDRSGRRVT